MTNLDFSWMNSLNQEPEKAAGRAKPVQPLQAWDESFTRSQAVYEAHRQAEMEANTTITRLLQGLQTGENLAQMLLLACKALSLATGNQAIEETARNRIKSVYAEGLQDTEALQAVLADLQSRHAKISASLDKCMAEDRMRLQASKTAVEREINRLENVLKLKYKAGL